MNPNRSPVLTTLPRTLGKRLEIADAIRRLAAQDEDGSVRAKRADAAALRRDLEKIEQDVLELWRLCEPRARSHVIKYSTDQPRVPKGNTGGGQWTSEDAFGSSSVSGEAASSGTARPVQYAEAAPDTRTDVPVDGLPAQDDGGSGQRPTVVASNDWRNLPVNLIEEEAPNGPGHAVSKHVANPMRNYSRHWNSTVFTVKPSISWTGLKDHSTPSRMPMIWSTVRFAQMALWSILSLAGKKMMTISYIVLALAPAMKPIDPIPMRSRICDQRTRSQSSSGTMRTPREVFALSQLFP